MNKNKKKRLIENIVMIVAAIAIVVSAVMIIGHYKGWFDKDANMFSANSRGMTTIERDGVNYTLSEDSPIKDGDIIQTQKSSKMEILVGEKDKIILGESTKIKIKDAYDTKIELVEGEIFASSEDDKLTFLCDTNNISVKESIAGITAHKGSVSVYSLTDGNEIKTSDETKSLENNKAYTILEQDNVWGILEHNLELASLSRFFLDECNAFVEKGISIDKEQLTAEIEKRDKESTAVINENLNSSSSNSNSSNTTTSNDTGSTSNKNDDSNIAAGNTSNKNDDSNAEVNLPTGDSSDTSTTGNTEDTGNFYSSGSSDSGTSEKKYVNITIRCDTILNNMDNLEEGKDVFVPSSGCILATSTIAIEDGDTAFDVTKKACEKAGIQIEYSYTPMYGSYYVEGINNLYEFDCGSESGWMYKVNGWFPNYGCSSYTLEDGDNIVWCYTCNGLGADVGGSVY